MKYFPLLLAICVVSTLGKVIYVDSTAASGGNGQQSSPYNSIQGAVNSVSVADGDQISIAFGYYTVLDMTITKKNVDVYAPNGAYVACNDSTTQVFTISSTTGVSIRNLYFSKCLTSILFFSNTTGSLVQGCTFNNNSGSPSSGVIQLRAASKVNIESSSFSFNTITAVLAAAASTANITNSFFRSNSGASASQGGGITATSSTILVSSSKFISNQLAIYSPQASTLNIVNSNFYSNSRQPSSNFSIICTSPTLTQSGNSFCGYLGATVSCGSWTPVLTSADSCGICGGNNVNKDCNGYCFGNATGNCPTRKTIWVVPGGNGTKDGSSKANAMATIQAAIDSASYGDTVKLGEGSYTSTGNYNLDTKGKAITITSEYGQPERTIITCADQSTDTGLISSSSESYDTIIKGITFSGCYYGVQVLNSNPTFQSVIFTQCYASGAYLTGSASSFTDCDFATNGATFTFAMAGLYTITTSGYFASNRIKYSRFSNNLNYRAGGLFIGANVIVNLDSCFFVQNKVYVGTNGNSLYLDQSATLNVYNTSINTNITTGNAIYCAPSTAVVNQTSNSFCGNNGNALSCTQWGTTPTLVTGDECGVCGGHNTSRDCNGTCFGRNEADSQGGCCLYWQKDCNMICNGKSVVDSFNTCCVPPKTIDCTGKCGGTYKTDKNGLCCDASIIDNNNVCCTNGTIDCNGICNGGWVTDTKGQCCPIAWKDYCGICNGTNDSCQTCAKSCLNGGTCNNTIQTCSCTGGYYGEQCELYSCPAGCHGGTCVAPNMCNCNGTNGSPPNCLPAVTCGNITCYNNGTCTANACDCTSASGYFGTECTNFTCTTTCKNSGVCIGPDLCDCSNSNGFFGNLCDQFSCPNGCSNGVCTSPNTCSCLQGWGGPTCATEQGVSLSATLTPILILAVVALASLFVL